MDETRTTTLAGTARRHGWVVCAGMLLGVGAGGLAFAHEEPVYSSSVSVLVQPVAGGEVNLPTEAELARATETAVNAAELLGLAAQIEPASVEAVPDTSVLVIRFEGRTPEAARAGARAFAEAYLTNRAHGARTTIDGQIAALTTKITEFDQEAAVISSRLVRLPATSPEAAGLRGTLSTLTAQTATLTTRVNDLATTTVNPGRIIGEPIRPKVPIRPDGWLYLAVSAGAGGLVGLATAMGRHRFSRQVRHGADVPHRSGVSVLAELPGEGAGLRSPKEPAGRAFNRLRNEVVASLGPDDRVILVTGARPGAASTVVAANLAAAFARADTEVVLVGANVPDIGPEILTLSQIFDVADIPGLTDVLTGRASLSRALQRASRFPRLRIVTPGGTASAAGLLQSEGARGAVNALRRQARYVLVEAPSTAAGADAQSLAGVADAAIVVVETGRTRHAQVADAARQLRLMGTRLLGAVVLAKVVAEPPEPESIPPMHRAEDVRGVTDDVWFNDPPLNDPPQVEDATIVLKRVSDAQVSDVPPAPTQGGPIAPTRTGGPPRRE